MNRAPHVLADAAVPRLLCALHRRMDAPFMDADPDLTRRSAQAGTLAGRQLAEATQRTGWQPQAVFLCSTLLDQSVTTCASAVRALRAGFADAGGHALHGIVNAYLCAGWGFVLRHLMRNTRLRRVALCIADLDLHGLDWQREHPVIGRAGFGLSTLLFDLPAHGTRLPQCGGPHANSAFTEMLMAVLAHRRRHGLLPTLMPFTQAPMYTTAARLLTPQTLAPNRYDTLGHCFGSDPWIALMTQHRETPACAGTRMLAAAIGFNGYYTISEIDLDAGLFTQLAGSAATSQRPDTAPRNRTAATADATP